MPALPSSIIELLWYRFEALLPPVENFHPPECHQPRVADRVVFDKLVSRLLLGGAYAKHADNQVSATPLRTRRDESTAARVLVNLEQAVLETFDWLIGLDLERLGAVGCCVKTPCGGDNTDRNPTDRSKSGRKRSVLCEGLCLSIGVVLDRVNRQDSPLLRSSLERLPRFGFHLSETIRVNLDAGYDSGVTRDLLDELGCERKISAKGTYIEINHTHRWKVERTTPGTPRIRNLANRPRPRGESTAGLDPPCQRHYPPTPTAQESLNPVPMR